MTRTTYGDGSPSVERTYTADGLPETTTSGGTVWSNTYNKRRLLESESLAYGGVNYAIVRDYDANGSVRFVRHPVDNLVIDYAPNALGEPTRAGTYATNVTYHPNGSVAGFTYGNGIVRTMTQNLRGLPQRSQDAGVLNDVYAYDGNGSPTSITDEQEGLTNRTMAYDGLDRLTSVAAPNLWGTATYTYDSLDNILTSTITGGATARSNTHNYDAATNRLTSITSNVAAYNMGFTYDAQGNITQRGAQGFPFDRPIA